ncbi:gephyrin-like molybdotransferase receptor GlpR [Corynebacterium sp. c24Ua_83]|uniref:divisome protein SepX/GlpR n=1 Tax=Corynebacterium sp. c24Ua_83 TaxID=3032350 RepID=UPI0032639290
MSGSLLLIAAVWLVLLAPLLLRNQKPVRRTAQALSETRVLHRGGSTLKAKRKLKPAEGLYMSSDDDELELVDAEPEYVLLEDEDSAAGAKSGKPRGLRALMNTKGSERSEDSVDAEVVDGEVVDAEMVDAEVVDAEAADAEAVDAKAKTAEATEQTDANGDGSDAADKGSGRGAEKVSEKVVAAASAGSAVRYTAQDEMDTGEFSPVKKAEMSAESAESSGSSESSDSSDSTEHAEQSEEQSARQAAYAAVPTEYVRGGDVKASPDLVDHVDEAPTGKNLDILEDSDELSEADLQYLASRRGRGVYDPVASARLARERQNRRKKVLLVLLALCALTFGASLALGSGVWLTFVAMVAFTAFYLVMLRRQAIEERELRHRRLVRMRRARLGVRNTEDDELGVPDRLIRPGAVILETDEDDPAFSNLEYADGSDFFDVPGGGSDAGAPSASAADEEYLDPRSGIRAV